MTDKCTEMLLNNFYVDNLVKISNFSLKYNTNNSSLQELIKYDGNFVEHGSKTEKVLAYIYSPEKDSINININKIRQLNDESGCGFCKIFLYIFSTWL